IASLEPVADAFIASGENSCGGFDCESVDSGGSPQGLLENVAGEFQSHLLLSFDLGALVGVHQRLSSVTLTVFVLHRAELDLEVSQVFPIALTEGDGLGTESAGP